MRHSHQHDPVDYNRAFALGVGLNAAFVVAEAGAGLAAGSLALLADAGHNLSDVLGLLLAWGASWLAARSPTRRRTYGLRRSTILAALLNAMLLLVAVGGICWEAVRRLASPLPPPGTTVVWIAAVGIAINTATALLFLRGGKRDVNIRGAFLHMAADAAVSLGVVIAGIVMQLTAWAWIDPVVSLAIAAIILLGTWSLFRESLDLALDAVPAGIDPVAVHSYLSGVPGVAAVHDLHIWALGTSEAALTAHLVMPEPADHDRLLADLSRELHDRFGIEHATVQIEHGSSEACPTGAGCEVRTGS
jgi:cobalt-zinc-cadmium efflux system protein